MPVIGLPKGLFYFEHHILWKNFFENMGCTVVVSEDTNKKILDFGVKHCSNETCLPVKVFHGHVYSLKDKVDYIFIPRYISTDSNEYTCPKFCGLPDMTYINLKKEIKILELIIDLNKSSYATFQSLSLIASTLNLDTDMVSQSFKGACIFYQNYKLEKPEYQLLKKQQLSDKFALSVLGHPYMIYDNYLSMKLIEKLLQKNIPVYTPTDLDRETKRRNAYPFQGKAFWETGFEILGSAFTFAQDLNIRGIIYLTPFACGIDSFIMEFIERRFKENYNLPLLKLTIDEHTGEAGFDTRLEAFLDMVVP